MNNYINIVKNLKQEILKSRYNIAKVANKELLFLYYKVGNIISEKVASEKWGNKTIEKLSEDLQNELKGLRGFSSTNLKRMKFFYEEWASIFHDNLKSNSIDLSLENENLVISPLLTYQFKDLFTKVSFISHYEIITSTKTIDERVFYISKAAKEFWSVRTLKHYLKNNIFESQKQFPNNFKTTVAPENFEVALNSFRGQYLLDFISFSDKEQDNERVLEKEIVNNIKDFLMSLGSDFAFLGNQYRIIVSEKEFFIDLLFYNRKLQSLVDFELKTGEFKPEYLGKMNFHLSALDEYVKQKHENPSIGIILCKEKDNKIVEFSFRDCSKSMGVSTYNK